jgi:presequence protease
MPNTTFTLLDERPLAMLGGHARRYRHAESGAEVLHVAHPEPNFSFAIGFATLPSDDTGVAHILEHMVLAGSRRYQVKDPFFEMVKGSVAGFINAMTWPDRTIYPFATDHPGDYLNLLAVYLDAVFHPLLSRETFDQEAWHLEPGAEAGTVAYRGIVFNEMKGAYGNPDRALIDTETSSLLPGTLYAYDAGGNPAAIPDLTYEALLAFHREYYHPSRARIVLHGDVPAETFAILDGYLSGATPLAPLAPIPAPTPFDAPRSAEGSYPADASGKSFATTIWALPDAADPADALWWDVVERVLIGTAAAPLRRALLDAGLGEAFLGRYTSDARTATFSVGLRGVARADCARVHALVLGTLTDLAENEAAIPDDAVIAARNRLEFATREADAYGGQPGLALAIGVLPEWLRGHDPLRELDVDAAFATLDTRYLAQGPAEAVRRTIRRDLLTATHRVDVAVHPDTGLTARWNEAERARLAAIAAELGPDGIAGVAAAARALAAHQDRPEDPRALAALPRLHPTDLAASRPQPERRTLRRGSAEIVHTDLPTRGIVYVDAAFDLSHLPELLALHVGLLGRLLLETGTTRTPLAELVRRIDRDTGGLSAALELHPGVLGRPGVTRFVLRGRALAERVDTLVDLMQEVLREARLTDLPAAKRFAIEDFSRRRNALEAAGTRFAAQRLAAAAGREERLAESLGGIASLPLLTAFARRCDDDVAALAAELTDLRAALFTAPALVLGVTADAASFAHAQPALERFVDALPDAQRGASDDWAGLDLPDPVEGWTLPGQVHYTARRWTLGTAPLPGAWIAATRHLSADVLIPALRFKGGAYGAGAGLDPLTGAFVAQAYRDPNLPETLAVFDTLAQHLRDAASALDDDAFATLIVGSVGKLDPYTLPGSAGYRSLLRYLRGTDGVTERLRSELLATDRSDFLALADALEAAPPARTAVLGPRSSLERYASAGWVVRQPAG